MSHHFIPSIGIEDINMGKCYFNPGCAMNLYKPELTEMIWKLLLKHFGDVKIHNICCHHNPGIPDGSTIINNCAGCDRRFRSDYEGIQTISIWEILDGIKSLELPDYGGFTVSIHDSCSFRRKPQVHAAVRSILEKMNINIIESEFSKTKSICCGDNFYGHIPPAQVVKQQEKRASQMPCEDVVVYCIGCVRSMTVGGKKAHYLPEMILGRQTQPMNNTLEEYHNELDAYMKGH